MISSSVLGAIRNGIVGSTYNATNDPDKTLNYASCHDNYTLFDRFTAFDKANKAKTGHVDFTLEEKEKMNILANAIVFTSQGTSFMLAGEEFLRSKGEDLTIAKNSYNASYKANELDYSLLVKHERMMPIYQSLIALKQNFAGLHLSKKEASRIAISASATSNQLVYSFEDENTIYKFVHNNGYGQFDDVDLSGYSLYLDTIEEDKTLSAKTPTSAYETLIAYKAK
jgi:pullulanase